MDFTFSEEQQMMATALRELAADLCTPGALRAAFEGEDATAAETRWRRLAELGLFGTLAPASAGGLGLGDADFVLLAEEAGRAALPEPLTEQAALAVPLLAECTAAAAAQELLPLAAAGSARIALAHPQNPEALIPPGVTHFLLCSAELVELAPAAAVRVTSLRSIDAARRIGAPRLHGPSLALAAGAPARETLARALNRGAVHSAAQCLGVAERLLALAAEYARGRVQFGKPIGSYQAVKHQLANVAVKLEFARAVVYAASSRAGALDPRSLAAASHAKLSAAAAAELAARTAIQVHGAMGYSWELDLHFYMKRAWSLAAAWGDHSFHARRLQGLLSEDALALGPDQTFG